MRKRTANILFRLICLLFSALLAILTLLSGIDLTAESEQVAQKRQELRALQEENGMLTARAARGLSLAELEEYAIRELGMQHCEPDQIYRIRMEG